MFSFSPLRISFKPGPSVEERFQESATSLGLRLHYQHCLQGEQQTWAEASLAMGCRLRSALLAFLGQGQRPLQIVVRTGLLFQLCILSAFLWNSQVSALDTTHQQARWTSARLPALNHQQAGCPIAQFPVYLILQVDFCVVTPFLKELLLFHRCLFLAKLFNVKAIFYHPLLRIYL